MILAQWQSCDGYKVRCRLASGEIVTWTLAQAPKDAKVAVVALEAAHVAALAVEAATLKDRLRAEGEQMIADGQAKIAEADTLAGVK